MAVYILADRQDLWINGLILSTIAVVLLQHAINLFNDVSDWRLGADSEKMDSWVRVHQQKMGIVKAHGSVSFLAGGLLGLAVLFVSAQEWILIYATPLVVLGFLYNAGKKPLSYTSMGEWVTGLCYGPGVFGCLWLVAGQAISIIAILGMAAFTALSMALLLSHQPPQIETDRRAGKHSFAVRYGALKTYSTSRLLFITSLTLIGAGLLLNHANVYFLVCYWLALVMTGIYLFNTTPNPKRLLIPGAIIISASVMAQL